MKVAPQMSALHGFSPAEFFDSLISLSVAFVLGTLIGAERQYRQRSGGLRTNVLVSVGAATFVDVGMNLSGHAGATQVIAYVVSGVGFLGAGVIMKEGKNVWGLNTAATLWCSAAVGACAGADLAFEAIALTAFVLAGNTLLRPLVNAINRAPLTEQATEATYEVRATTDADHVDEARELLELQLERTNYPVREVAVLNRDLESMEVVATLVANTAEPGELHQLVARLETTPFIEHASWTVRASD
jgi:putative Mg2+ transporter-C (MgtC) family protein